jgi:uncharacterized protein (TIGR00251 family)
MTVKPEPYAVRAHAQGALLDIKVRPGSKHRGISGFSGARLSISVISPPRKGKANKEALVLLSETLAIPRSSMVIIRGLTSRHKTILLKGISAHELHSRLTDV